ncbi:MAG: hypothetical protein WC954_06320 [Sphaerochaeta sp.]
MAAVPILAVIFIFIIIISVLDHAHSERKRKIEAALRMREMELGYPPGTYSSPKWSKKFSNKNAEDAIKEVYEQFASKGSTRVEMEQGIVDLEERLGNLEEILRSRKSSYDKEEKE